MADITRLSRFLNGVNRGVDISSNTLVVDNIKIKLGGSFNLTFAGALTANHSITMPDADVDLGDIATLNSASHAAVTLNSGDASQQSASLAGQELTLNQATGATDGVMSAEDKTKLDAIEAGATADQSGAEIKAAYEAEANAFTDAQFTKLAGIESGATGDQTGAEIKAAYEAEANAYTDAKDTKLAGIESGATADQTGAEIKAAYEAEANAFTDAQFTKLAGIEAAADVTDATNVDAAGAVMESDASTASMSFVIDEDDMVSDSATKVPTQQSVKAYVDNTVSSAVSYKGGYDAATDSPSLDSAPNVGIAIGDQYTVTVAGTFYTIDVEVGDVLIAEVADPTAEADWTIVNKNLDAASIKAQYESNANTNEFSDAEQTKLAGIEASATGDQTGAEIKALYEAEANAYTDAKDTKLAGIEANATADQTGAEIKAAYEAEANAFTDAQFTKLAGIESGATADQTGAEIKAAYEAEANAFTDAQFTKLAGIEAGATADQSAAEVPYSGPDLAGADVDAALDDAGSRIDALETSISDTESLSEDLIAGEAMPTGLRALRWGKGAETAGSVYLADKDASSQDDFHVMGLVVAAGETATSALDDVVKAGKMAAAAHGFTVGEPIYLSAAGVLTNTAPSAAGEAIVKVGMARTSAIIEVQIQIMGVN